MTGKKQEKTLNRTVFIAGATGGLAAVLGLLTVVGVMGLLVGGILVGAVGIISSVFWVASAYRIRQEGNIDHHENEVAIEKLNQKQVELEHTVKNLSKETSNIEGNNSWTDRVKVNQNMQVAKEK